MKKLTITILTLFIYGSMLSAKRGVDQGVLEL
jgi:hypothetical protein